jgi:uncharacterized membrane protein YkoI
MKKPCLLFVVATTVTCSMHAWASTPPAAGDAKLTMAEARVIALKTFAGSITKEELEKEKGGSGLRYSFDIASADKKVTREVGVDAMTGAILENVIEGKDKD